MIGQLIGVALLVTAPALEPCAKSGPERELRCGSLDVPEDPSKPHGRSISLRIVVVPALERREQAAPLYHLEGGPGVAATNAAPFYLGPGREYRRRRDVVLIDQRGTGGSHPLRCPKLEARKTLEELYPVDLVKACRTELEKNADLTMYGTEMAADDLDRVRASFGHRSIDIWALSYGTAVAQVYLERFPDRVRSAVLVGAVPHRLRTPLHHAMNAQRAWDLVLFECQVDERCRAAHPSLRRDWLDLLAKLERGEAGAIRRDIFGEAIRTLLTTTAAQRNLPSLIHQAARGRREPLLAALDSDSSQLAEGLYLSIACSEGTLFIRPEEIAPATAGTFLGDYRIRQQLAACRAWPRASIPADFAAPPKSRAPVLMLSGDMDHVAPPAWSHEICGRFPNCRVISFPQLAHGPFDLDVWTNGDCFDRIAREFFTHADPARADASCIATMRPPPFATSR